MVGSREVTPLIEETRVEEVACVYQSRMAVGRMSLPGTIVVETSPKAGAQWGPCNQMVVAINLTCFLPTTRLHLPVGSPLATIKTHQVTTWFLMNQAVNLSKQMEACDASTVYLRSASRNDARRTIEPAATGASTSLRNQVSQ